jgi:hypothetical protein
MVGLFCSNLFEFSAQANSPLKPGSIAHNYGLTVLRTPCVVQVFFFFLERKDDIFL